MIISVPMTASAATTKLTKREQAIVKAYVKTVETGDLKYLNRYKYPGTSYIKPDYAGKLDVKLLNVKYSKAYDSKKKLNCLYASGLFVLSTEEQIMAANIKMGIYLKKKGDTVYAYTENVDDVSADDYLFAEDLTDKQLATIEEYLIEIYGEDTANYLLYGEEDTETEEDADTEEDDTDSDDADTEEDAETGNVSSASGSIDNPIKMGDAYEWAEKYEFTSDEVSGKFSLTVKNVKELSTKDIEAMGFRASSDKSIEYKLVTVRWEVKKAELTKVKGDGEMYKSLVTPDFWGSEADNGQYIIGITDYGFDTSLQEQITKVVKFETFVEGDTISYVAEGDVIVPVIKGQKNYMIIDNRSIEDYDASKIHLALE